ncbi:blue copper protein 1a-like [Trifolium pratense]|uniref:blue copper protein 1a-like n=1 Tax=Trifolium pratense TaxID=57577 RepID=UPI001E695ADC|nr:blue copper protein 1a-like [Trifolium pratense]
MALSRALFLLALIATIFSTMAMAKDFVVGDKWGWRVGVDYQSWAANKVFHVGDTITFNYVAGKDNVVRVNGSDFKSCLVPLTSPVLTSGHDTILFTTTGRRWYISGVADHCSIGQKLVITVLQPSSHLALSPVPSASPSPTPSSPVPAPEAVESDAQWSPVPSPSASSSPSPSPTPAHEAAASDAQWSPVPSPSTSLSPSPSDTPAHEAAASDAQWSPVPSPSDSLSPSPSPIPAPEAAPSDAPWTAPRRSLLPKKLFKIIHKNFIGA